jgi:hypothetical protein
MLRVQTGIFDGFFGDLRALLLAGALSGASAWLFIWQLRCRSLVREFSLCTSHALITTSTFPLLKH